MKECRVFIPVDEFDKRQWRSIAVQFVSEAEISQGAGFLLRTAVRVRVPDYALVLVSGSESCKKHDKQLTFIVRVSSWGIFVISLLFTYLSYFFCLFLIPIVS